MKWETLKLFDTHGREHPKGFAIYLMRGCDPTPVVAAITLTFRGVGGAQRRMLVRHSDGTPGWRGYLVCRQCVG